MGRMPEDPLAALARLIGGRDPFASPVKTDCHRCFAVSGVFCDDCPATIDNQREYPRVRQIPYKYHTDEYGPVFAYQVTEDGRAARCVSADDKVVECSYAQLLPFRIDVSGAEAIELLDSEVGEMMSPHMDGRSYKYQPPFRSTIGRFLFSMRVWQGALYEA